MKLAAFGHTDVGLMRDHNEDALLLDEALGLYIVADGVGGAAAGEVASQITCQVMHEQIKQATPIIQRCAANAIPEHRDAVILVLEHAAQKASEAVFAAAQADDAKQGMASTLAAVLVVGHLAFVIHAGDSRVYLGRQGKMYQLTEDHSAVTEKLRQGTMTPEEARTSPLRNVITRVIGVQPIVEPDTLQVELATGDRLLLCSDGLSNYLPIEELSLAFEKLTPMRMGPALISTANKRGGADNITAIVVQVIEGAPPTTADPLAKIAALRAIRLFKQLTYKELHTVLSICRVEVYQQGDRILEEGEPAEKLFVSINGEVQVVKQGQVIATLPGGSSFGEMALMDQSPRSADVIATQPTRVLSMSRKHFMHLLQSQPKLGVKLLWAMCHAFADRLRETSAELSWTKQVAGEPANDEWEWPAAE